jgi:hypothetical protein
VQLFNAISSEQGHLVGDTSYLSKKGKRKLVEDKRRFLMELEKGKGEVVSVGGEPELAASKEKRREKRGWRDEGYGMMEHAHEWEQEGGEWDEEQD